MLASGLSRIVGLRVRAACLVLVGVGLLGAGSARAVTVAQVAKLVGDCGKHCGGARGTGESQPGAFGQVVALSGDGSTALIGTPLVKTGDGAAWVFVRRAGRWQQQGPKLIVDCRQHCGGPNGTGEDGNTFSFGEAVALSANGNTALIGAPGNGERGGAWVFTRSRGHWRQQGARLIGFCHPDKRVCKGPNGTGLKGYAFGQSVALSADGSIALIGAPGGPGAMFVFSRRAGRWSQQARLIGNCRPSSTHPCTGPNGTGMHFQTGLGFGSAVAASADGSTVLIGGLGDGSPSTGEVGAAWIFTRSGKSWSQQGSKLVGNCVSACTGSNGTGEDGDGWFGSAAALSSDGNTALIGAGADGKFAGAAWVFARAGGLWSQQGEKLVGDCTTVCDGPRGTGETNSSDGGGEFGSGVALTADGNTALIGAPLDLCGCVAERQAGAAWLFTRSGITWSQQGGKLITDCTSGCGGSNGTGERDQRGGQFGTAAAFSSNGATALIGAANDDCFRRCDGSLANPGEGAAWVFSLTL